MLGFKRFSNGAVVIAGGELAHRIRKGQIDFAELGFQGKPLCPPFGRPSLPHGEVSYRQAVSRINQIFERELSNHVLPLCFHLQTRHWAGLHPYGVEHPGHAQKEIALSLVLIVDSASARDQASI
jgi:hypothetical protein